MTLAIATSDSANHFVDIQIDTLADCQALAELLASTITTPMTVALSGTLGAGKTQFTRFFAMALGAPSESISSPTFMLVHQYPGTPIVFHLDAYRIGDEEEMLELGIEEMFETNAVTIIEWADRFPALLPSNFLEIHIEIGDQETCRRVQLKAVGKKAQAVFGKLLPRLSV